MTQNYIKYKKSGIKKVLHLYTVLRISVFSVIFVMFLRFCHSFVYISCKILYVICIVVANFVIELLEKKIIQKTVKGLRLTV